jgi:uroporphyrinogen-III synthase
VTGPLAGVTVVVTRPRAQAAGFAARMTAAGATPLLLPALEIEPVELDAEARARLAPDAHDWTVFTSANAVEHGLGQLPAPQCVRVAAIGRGTARALATRGVTVDAMPHAGADSEGLLAHPALAGLDGRRVLIVKGEGGRTLLREELSRRGARVATAEVYRRVAAHPDPALLDELATACDAGCVVVAVTSRESLAALLEAAPAVRVPRLRAATLVVPGARVAAAARDLGWQGPVGEAASAEDAAMAEAVLRAAAGGGPGAAC